MKTLDLATLADIPELHRVRTSVLENRLADPSRVQPEDHRAMLTERGRGWVARVDGLFDQGVERACRDPAS